MNRKTTGLLALTLIAVSVTLFGVKWKRDNPTPTAEDEVIRQRLIRSKEAYVYRAATSKGKSDYIFYILSPSERKQIANRLFLIKITESNVNPSSSDFEIGWGDIKSCHDRIFVNNKLSENIYQNDCSPGLTRRVHPTTRAYLQQWIEHQPIVRKQLAKNKINR